MRTLKFVVDGNTLSPAPDCNFDGLFPGKEKEVRAAFVFGPDWEYCTKVVAFWSILGSEYPPQMLGEDNSCMIPAEALERPAFKIQLLRMYNGGVQSTNQFTIYQKGGNL